MDNSQTPRLRCPYCTNDILEYSKDHIFPEFLGGTRKIASCKNCNDIFGHTFEAKAANILQPLHIIISSWGIPLKSATPEWKNAHIKDGERFNFSVGERGMTAALADPAIEFYEDGVVKQGKFPTRKQAEKMVKSLKKKGKARKNIRIEEVPSERIHFPDIPLSLNIDHEIKRLALKMCIGLSTMMPAFDITDVNEARLYLRGNPDTVPVNNVFTDFESHNEIDSKRKNLSHTIYVERSPTRGYGLVQFFGSIQLFCRLRIHQSNSTHAAFMATLDPLTGEETFLEVPPLEIAHPPYLIPLDDYPKLAESWIMKLKSNAAACGANAIEFNIKSVKYNG